MSDFIRTLNLIKTQRDLTWLAPSQQDALTELREALRMPGTVNLFGMAGVGKTFLAWTLANELDYTYLAHISHFEQVEDLYTKGVVLDNCLPKRQFHRNMLKAISFRNVSCAVLVTRQMIQDYTRYVELRLTPSDQVKVGDNLATLGVFRKVNQAPNLWHVVNPHL